jgi:hypothetical protein
MTTTQEKTPEVMATDSASARKLLLKCDLRLVPILGTLYLVSFFDRSNIANARLFGLEKSLNMPSNGFNTCLWIFYLPFVIIEIPSNLIMSMNKIKPNYWLAGMMFILGESRTTQSCRLNYLQAMNRSRFHVPGIHQELRWFACLPLPHGYPRGRSPTRHVIRRPFRTYVIY